MTDTPITDLATARTAVETISAPSIGPTTTMGSSTYTWTEMLDNIQSAMKVANGGSADIRFHLAMIELWTVLEAEMAAV